MESESLSFLFQAVPLFFILNEYRSRSVRYLVFNESCPGSCSISYTKKDFLPLAFSCETAFPYAIIPSLTVAKESRAHKRRNYAIYELLFSF